MQGYADEPIDKILLHIDEGPVEVMDRWLCNVWENPQVCTHARHVLSLSLYSHISYQKEVVCLCVMLPGSSTSSLFSGGLIEGKIDITCLQFQLSFLFFSSSHQLSDINLKVLSYTQHPFPLIRTEQMFCGQHVEVHFYAKVIST